MSILKKPSWKIRRRIIYATLSFCALEVAYLTVFGKDTGLEANIIFGCFGLAASVIGSYVFGAVWDDKNHPQVEQAPVPAPTAPDSEASA